MRNAENEPNAAVCGSQGQDGAILSAAQVAEMRASGGSGCTTAQLVSLCASHEALRAARARQTAALAELLAALRASRGVSTRRIWDAIDGADAARRGGAAE